MHHPLRIRDVDPRRPQPAQHRQVHFRLHVQLAVARIADPAPAARLARFGPDGLEFSLLFWIEDPVNGQGNVKSDVNLRILKGLRAAGIDIPYPQRVVRVISSATEATG